MRRPVMAPVAMPNVSWKHPVFQLAPDDVLVLYMDGVTGAQNGADGFLGQQGLLEVVQASAGCSAPETQEALLRAVRGSAGGTFRFDDVTLMIAVQDTTD